MLILIGFPPFFWDYVGPFKSVSIYLHCLAFPPGVQMYAWSCTIIISAAISPL